MKRSVLVIVSLLLLTITGVGDGGGRGGGHSPGAPSTGPVHVPGYFRKDGTYVQPYDRGRPSDGSNSTVLPGSSGRNPTVVVPGSDGKAAASSGIYLTSAPGARGSDGRLVRSEAAKREFMRDTGYPHGRPGYVVDHITPLKRDGCDCPANMQWQTVAEAKAKDKWE